MSTGVWKELSKYEKQLEDYRRKFAPGGYDQKELAILKEVKSKIDNAYKKLMASGEIVVVSDPPPTKPINDDGHVAYQGMPTDKLNDREKRLAEEGARRMRGNVQGIDGWSKQLHEKEQKTTQKSITFDVVKSNSEEANAAFAKDIKSGAFKKLAKKDPTFTDKLSQYGEASGQIDAKLSELREQAFRIAAAQAMIAQAEMLIEAYEKGKDRDKAKKEVADLEAKLKDTKEKVTSYVEWVTDPDPKAKAKKLIKAMVQDAAVDFIVNEILNGKQVKKQIDEAKARLARIEKRLDELNIGGLKAGLSEAMNTYQAEATKVETTKKELDNAKARQRDAVNKLADVEQSNPGTTSVFGELKEYYRDVTTAGAEVMQATTEYAATAGKTADAMKNTQSMREQIANEKSVVNSRYLSDAASEDVLNHQNEADQMLAYTKNMDEWYKSQKVDKELAKQAQARNEINTNQHLKYADQLIGQIKKQGLGHI